MAKRMTEARVLSQEDLGGGIYSMWIRTPEIARQARAGQFITLYTKDASRLLPRPLSICETDRQKGALRLVYRVAGAGTREFAAYTEGDAVTVMGPLGNGFPAVPAGKKALLVGGGIGIPPLLQLAKELVCEKTAVLGYRDRIFLEKDFAPYCAVEIAAEDGRAGVKGNVLDAIREKNLTADVILACGPVPMLRALKEYAGERDLQCYLSLEERMACGVGACLGCVCGSSEADAHSRVCYKRVCRDGPVFSAGEVKL